MLPNIIVLQHTYQIECLNKGECVNMIKTVSVRHPLLMHRNQKDSEYERHDTVKYEVQMRTLQSRSEMMKLLCATQCVAMEG